MPVWQFCECSRHLLEQVLAIEAEAFAFPWKPAMFESQITCRDCLNRAVIEAEPDNRQTLIAYLFSRIIMNELHIFKIAVAPDCRRRGIASALLEHGFELARDKGCTRAVLEVRSSNRAARRLYETVGFQRVEKRLSYYPDTGEAALTFTKDLEEN